MGFLRGSVGGWSRQRASEGKPVVGTRQLKHSVRISSRKKQRGGPLLLLALAVSAYVTALAVGSHPHPWLGLLTLLPLLRTIQVSSPRRALIHGWLWGAMLYGFTVTVIETTVSPGLWSLILLTTIPAAYAFFGAHITRRVGFNPFVLGVGWMLVEFALRPLALHRGLLAGTQGDGLLIALVGRAFGYVMVAFLVAYASAKLLDILSRLRFRLPRLVCTVGLDDVGQRLWQLIPSRRPCFILPPASHPRAPPLHLA